MAQTARYITNEQCDEIAKKILVEAGLYPSSTRPTIDVEKLAESYPGVVLDQFAPIENPKILGMTTFSNTGAKIEINAAVTKRSDGKYALPSEKSIWRTTVAHELGHVILHTDIAQRELRAGQAQRMFRCAKEALHSRPRTEDYDPLEYQANMMMAALLMPAELVVAAHTHASVVNDSDYEVLGDLSESFSVSIEAMKIRLRELRLN